MQVHLRTFLLCAALGSPAAGQLLQSLPEGPRPSDPRIPHSLYTPWLMRDRPLEELRNASGRGFVKIDDQRRVHVELVAPWGESALSDEFIRGFGGLPESRWQHRVEAWVPVEQLMALTASLPATHRLERATPGEYDSEGPGVVGSDVYRDAGADGSGLTIAIIDGDFDELSEAVSAGGAPGGTVGLNYTSESFQEDSPHGTGCLEAAYDHAPGATYRLYKTNSIADLLLSVQDCISNGVDVISYSISQYNQGWADDQGDACLAANMASNAGILFFTSAGNRAEKHWQGVFNPGQGSALTHDWVTGDEFLTVTMQPGAAANVYLSWDRSGSDVDDYGLGVYDQSGALVGLSASAGETYESLSLQNTAFGASLRIAVFRFSGSGGQFELFAHTSGDVDFEYFVPTGSTTSPSNATGVNVISVGAVSFQDFDQAFPDLTDYSSRGPSNSGMILPDMVGPTGTSGVAYPMGFGGTSCATPNAAGAAAAFRSSVPGYNGNAATWLLEEQAAEFRDWGSPGSDNKFGKGGVYLVPHASKRKWLAPAFNNFFNVSTGPSYSFSGAVEDVATGGRILVFPGGTIVGGQTVVQKAMVIESVGGSAVIGF